jgi:uncharacterized protein YgiM (DUF1202 family)
LLASGAALAQQAPAAEPVTEPAPSPRAAARADKRERKQQARAERAEAKADREREQLLQVFVAEPYLELRTGPGRGYPVTQVVARDESVDVLFRRTDYFKVRTERGVEGWASARDMQRTLLADGSRFTIDLGDRAGFQTHRWEPSVPTR